jgi:hypothetical protein
VTVLNRMAGAAMRSIGTTDDGPSAAESLAPKGDLPVVICAGVVRTATDLESARFIALDMALEKRADAYVLKPILRVSSTVEVTVKDLA